MLWYKGLKNALLQGCHSDKLLRFLSYMAKRKSSGELYVIRKIIIHLPRAPNAQCQMHDRQQDHPITVQLNRLHLLP